MKKEDFDYLEDFLKSNRLNKKRMNIIGEKIIKAEMIDLVNKEVKERLKVDSFDSFSDDVEKNVFKNHILDNKDENTKSHIEVIKKGDIIEHIIVYCKCGEVIKIDLK